MVCSCHDTLPAYVHYVFCSSGDPLPNVIFQGASELQLEETQQG